MAEKGPLLCFAGTYAESEYWRKQQHRSPAEWRYLSDFHRIYGRHRPRFVRVGTWDQRKDAETILLMLGAAEAIECDTSGIPLYSRGPMTDTTYTKHTTHTDALDTLGTVITDAEKRDAIHLAVYPIEASETLMPGDHVYIDGDGMASPARKKGEGVGIVDPFLLKPVCSGEWFWLVVYPRKISSLRHVWEHPSFPVSEGGTPLPLEKSASEQWLRDFANRTDVPGFDEMMDALADSTEYPRFGTDASGEIPPDFWHHYENYLGVTVPKGERGEWFSCAC